MPVVWTQYGLGTPLLFVLCLEIKNVVIYNWMKKNCFFFFGSLLRQKEITIYCVCECANFFEKKKNQIETMIHLTTKNKILKWNKTKQINNFSMDAHTHTHTHCKFQTKLYSDWFLTMRERETGKKSSDTRIKSSVISLCVRFFTYSHQEFVYLVVAVVTFFLLCQR